MSRKELASGIWLMTMTLMSLCSCTVFYVARMLDPPYDLFYFALSFLLIVALLIYLWGPEKLKTRPARIGYRVLYASSIFVIPSFALQFFGLLAQYHAVVPDSYDVRPAQVEAGDSSDDAMPTATVHAESTSVEEIVALDRTVVYDTGLAYVIFPEYSSIELVCGERPSRSDETITWCSGAAFQHRETISFSQEDIEGDHAVKGTLYKSPYNQEGLTAFTFADGKYSFEFDDPTGAMERAAEAGGSGFMQFGLVRDGEILDVFASPPHIRCFRVLAELNGQLCFIDAKEIVHFEIFMAELRRLGVTNALYMDMGAGWNYSWFRDSSGSVVNLFPLPLPFSHNWVVFRK